MTIPWLFCNLFSMSDLFIKTYKIFYYFLSKFFCTMQILYKYIVDVLTMVEILC